MCKKIIEWLYLRTKNNLVYYDNLTGVYNRQFYGRVLIKKTINEEVVVIMLDLNNLKTINDTFGHASGDKLIIGITSSLKNYGTVCRLGGDEFLILTNNEKLELFKKYANNNDDFCYAYATKEKGVSLEHAIIPIDKELLKIKNDYRKKHPRGAVNTDTKN